jgi:2-C-methyl-D-erythritol 2,4-cyclodiphosphate synthase
VSEELRVGIGFDAHALAPGRPLVLAGVTIPSAVGLVGHSDGDLVCHAATDALLGASGGADIGERFGTDDPALEGASSLGLLREVWRELAGQGWRLVNLDTVVILQEPRLSPHRDAMRMALAGALDADVGRVTVRASTTDRLGFAGRGEGAACHAAALLARAAE